MFFFESLAQLRGSAAEFAREGVRIVLVLQARPEDLESICGGAPDLVCVPDPERRTHRALGLKRLSPLALFSLRDLWRRRREASKSGFRQNWKRTFKKESDGLLSPGAALVERGGRILWLHRGKHTADLPSRGELLTVVRQRAAHA